MARLARIVAPGCPHHVTARGNRREPIFFEDGDQDLYLDILAEHMAEAQVAVWAYCLMPNHVHLIACPETAEGLGRAMGAAHRRWANARGRWRGHLFDGRFASVVMDETHLLAAASAALLAAETTGRRRLHRGAGAESRSATGPRPPRTDPETRARHRATDAVAIGMVSPGLDWSLSRLWRGKKWSEWQDLNLRPPRPERGALPG